MFIRELQSIYSQPGKVENIIIRPSRLMQVEILRLVRAVKDLGLEGDHYKNFGGSRQVTLIQAEHIQVVASLLSRNEIAPELIRRNLVVRGINLLSLKGKRFTVGEAVLEYSGECHPCSRMEKNLGTGGDNAMRGHGGITAKVIQSGLIKIGDDLVAEHTNTEVDV